MIRPCRWVFATALLLVATVPSRACPLEPVANKEFQIQASSISEPLQSTELDASLISSEIVTAGTQLARLSGNPNEQQPQIEGMAPSIMSGDPLLLIDFDTTRSRSRPGP